MSILAWIEDQRKLKLLNAPKYNQPPSDGSKGLWTRCDNCGVILYIKHLKENQRVCFGCGYHLQMNSQERIEHLIDEQTWRPLDETLSPGDPLEFRDQKPYIERLKDAQEKTGLQDAVQTGTGMLDGIPIALGIMDFHFMGGSMGSVVGEKITRLIEYATQEGLTLVLVCASGGARMQEGIFSLMQMAKISSALQIYQSCANLLYISVLTSPTTGGVTASFAMLGDLIFAEPKALIGFAGRRVIEQTLQEDLPDDFQTSEYLLHHGLLDLIVPRCFLKQALSETITLYRDAPFKQSGHIPYGVQNPLYFLTEEKVRRKWQQDAHLFGGASWVQAASQTQSNPFLAKGEGFANSSTAGGEEELGAEARNFKDSLSTSSATSFTDSNPPSLHFTKKMDKAGGGHRTPSASNNFKTHDQTHHSPATQAASISEPTDQSFTNLLETWLADSSCDETYRDILMSFDTMFNLVAQKGASEMIPSVGSNTDDFSFVNHENIVLNESFSQTEESNKSYDNCKPFTEGKEVSFNQSLLLAAGEKVSWRAFYASQKGSPKAHFLQYLSLDTETNSPARLTTRDGSDSTSESEGYERPMSVASRSVEYKSPGIEKKFFYKTSKKDS
jgi:acetyl-CoA carboxylase carboxyl transferase subunit beta